MDPATYSATYATAKTKVLETIAATCDLVQEKIKSESAEDHKQLPNLIEALAKLVDAV